MGILLVLVIGGIVGYKYMFSSTEPSYATYTPPPAARLTDQERINHLQNDLGNAASEMAQLQTMAKKLQFGKMKAMGRHLQEVADQLQPQLTEIQNRKARRLLAQGIRGLRTVGEGSEQLDPDKSMAGVNEVLTSFDELNQLKASGQG